MYTRYHIFLSYGLLSAFRYVFAYAFAHSIVAVLVYFHKINVSSCFVRFFQRFHLGVRIVCSSLWDHMGLKLIHKTLRFVKAISSKALAML